MEPSARELDLLEQRIELLRREYDLFLAGRRRGEPTALRAEVEREVLRLTRHSFSSTSLRFRLGALAHRFRSGEAQVRRLLEQRESRRRGAEPPAAAPRAEVVLDRVAVANPKAVEGDLVRLHRALVEALGEQGGPTLDALRARLVEEARRALERPGMRGVRFWLAEDEAGAVRLRGEAVREA